MSVFFSNYLPWVILAMVVIAVVIFATMYAFNKRRYIDAGPRKGEAAKPGKVGRQNPKDRP